MFLVWIVEKYQEEGTFIFYWEMALNIHIKLDIWLIQHAE